MRKLYFDGRPFSYVMAIGLILCVALDIWRIATTDLSDPYSVIHLCIVVPALIVLTGISYFSVDRKRLEPTEPTDEC